MGLKSLSGQEREGKTTGNVGIGTTSLNYKLDVKGDINATSYRSNGTDYGEWLEKLNPDEQMEEGDVVAVVNGRITKSGNPGIGTANPSEGKVEVKGGQMMEETEGGYK